MFFGVSEESPKSGEKENRVFVFDRDSPAEAANIHGSTSALPHSINIVDAEVDTVIPRNKSFNGEFRDTSLTLPT